MAEQTTPQPPDGERLTTGIPGLDAILDGGLPRRSLTLIAGPPGAGKTVFVEQFAFHQVRQGARCLLFTALSESEERLFAGMRAFTFHDHALEGEQFQVLSLLGALADGDLEAVTTVIIQTVRAQRADLVIIDGFGGIAGFAPSPTAVPRFLAQVRSMLSLLGCTLLVTDVTEAAAAPDRALLTIADVIVLLRHDVGRWAGHRALRVQKLRTGAQWDGWHAFTITADGLVCFPRQEAIPIDPAPVLPAERAGFGVPALDHLLGGGLPAGSSSLLCGAPGTGKTVLALHYLLAGVAQGEPGALVGFHETAAELVAKAAAFGLDLAGAVAAGQITLLLQPPVEFDADQVVATVRAVLAARGVRRLVIDTVQDLEEGLDDPPRGRGFFAALRAYLHGQAVTTVGCFEVTHLVGTELDFRESPLLTVVDNAVLLRHLEDQGVLRRIIAVLKMRQSAYDSALRTFVLDPSGIRLLPVPEGAGGLLTGIARHRSRPHAGSANPAE